MEFHWYCPCASTRLVMDEDVMANALIPAIVCDVCDCYVLPVAESAEVIWQSYDPSTPRDDDEGGC